jgi:hypothetical protein
MGQSETPNHVRSHGSFPRKRSPGAGDGCAADHCQPCSQLVAELASIADHGAGDLGICNGPKAVITQHHLDHPTKVAFTRRENMKYRIQIAAPAKVKISSLISSGPDCWATAGMRLLKK